MHPWNGDTPRTVALKGSGQGQHEATSAAQRTTKYGAKVSTVAGTVASSAWTKGMSTRTLRIELLEARNLESSENEFQQAFDAYCVITLSGLGHGVVVAPKKTRVIPNHPHPKWIDDLEWELPMNVNKRRKDPLASPAYLCVEVFSERSSYYFDMFGEGNEEEGMTRSPPLLPPNPPSRVNLARDDALGIVQIPLSILLDENVPAHDRWWILDGTQSGEIRLRTLHYKGTKKPSGCKNALEWITSHAGHDALYDYYGFKVLRENMIEWNHLKSYYSCREERQVAKWERFLSQNGLVDVRNPELYSLVQQLVWDGIPRFLRESVYMHLSGAKDKKQVGGSGYYQDLITENYHTINASTKQIELDINRTFGYSETKISTEEGKMSLRRILNAYAARNPDVGYCQGLNFVTGFLLLLLPEESVFWILAVICEDLFPGYYTPSMTDSQTDMMVLKELIKERLPDFYEHAENIGIPIEILGTTWLLCLCTTSFPSDTVFRIFDCILLEGPTFLFSVIIGHLRMQQAQLLELRDLHAIVCHLKQIEVGSYDADIIIQQALLELRTLSTGQVDRLRRKHRSAVTEERIRVQTLQNQLAIARQIPGLSSYAVQVLRFIHREAELASQEDVVSLVRLVCHGLVWLAQQNRNRHQRR